MNSQSNPADLIVAADNATANPSADAVADAPAQASSEQSEPAGILCLTLKLDTAQAWVDTVMADFDGFLIDHAACERKAAGMALSLCTHYPDRAELVRSMSALAVEELMHYREVLKWMEKRSIIQQPDEKDPYINALQKTMGKGKQAYLRDRLLLAAIIERRGHERFGLVADALPKGGLKQFYDRITRSEDRHHELFLRLAERYCLERDPREHTTTAKNKRRKDDTNQTQEPIDAQTALANRLDELLTIEAEIVAELPIRAKLH